MQPEHASRLAAAWAADRTAPRWRELHGSAVLTDISGFTRLTERLTYGGAEGPEVLHAAICAALTSLLGACVDAGGDIIGFAGDSALVWFDAADHPQHAELAVEVASCMPRDIDALPAAMSGGRRLRVSVGVHTGVVQAHLVGSSQLGLFLCGPDTSTLVALQTRADPGQVLMSAATAAQVASTWCATPVGDAFAVRSRRRRPARAHEPAAEPMALPDSCQALLAPTVRELITDGATHGDFRTASFGFLKVWGLDGIAACDGAAGVHAALAQVVELVTRVAAEEAVEWLDVSPGVDSTSLLLSAGAPRSIEHDEDQMLIVLRRLVDECAVPVSAGAQRGRVFSGLLGVPGRRRNYTVMGDAVNVGARALGLAAPGEVVVGEGMAVHARRSFVHSSALGPQALRNRVRPVEMWRVTGVGPRPVRRRAVVGAGSGWLRSAEAALLAAAWKHTIDHRGRVVSVIGEPGMGASGLLADTAALAGGAATAVVTDPQRRHVPYAGLAAVVDGLAATVGAQVRSASDGWAWLGSFADRLPPYLRVWVPAALAAAEQREVHDLDPVSAAQRARMALSALIAAAAPRPWLLAIDDVDLMDEASCQVVARLCAGAGDQRLMVLAGQRPGTEPLGSLGPSALVDDEVLTIELGPLGDEEAAQLVIDTAPSLRDDLVARIVAAAAGNPFVLTELARTPIDGELPDSLQRLGAWLLDSLPAKTRSLVRDVSILGATVPVAFAAEVLGRPELANRQAWEAAAPVLRLADDGTVAFGHEAYLRVAYDTLPFQRRRALHAAVADHLAGVRDASDAVRATHLEHAGRTAEAYPLAAAAGRTAKAAGALTEAVDLLGRAAAMARVHDPAAVAGLLMDEAEARGWLADHRAMEQSLRSARRATTDPLVIGRICHLRADLALRHNQFAAAKRWANRGMAATVGCSSAGELRCFLLLDLGAVRDLSDDHLGSVPIYREALERATAIGSQLMEGLAHIHIEMAYSAVMDPRAIEHGDAAVRILSELGHHRYLQHALTNSGLTAMYLGRWDDAVDRYQRAIEGYMQYGHALGAATAVANVGFLRYRQGRLEEADERGRQAIRVYETAGVPHNAATARLLRAHVAAAERRFTDAAALVAEARAAFVAVDQRSMVLDCDVSTMEHLVCAGRYGDAVDAGGALVDRLAIAEPELRVTYDRVLGRAEAALGVDTGVARVEAALAEARELNLVYEVMQCLATLVDIADDGGPAVQQTVRDELERVRRSLGVVS